MKKNLHNLAQTQKMTNIHINDDNINILFVYFCIAIGDPIIRGGGGFQKLV